MLRKASTNERKADVSKSTTNKKDVFTSTEDLGNYFVYCAYYMTSIYFISPYAPLVSQKFFIEANRFLEVNTLEFYWFAEFFDN